MISNRSYTVRNIIVPQMTEQSGDQIVLHFFIGGYGTSTHDVTTREIESSFEPQLIGIVVTEI